MKVQRLFIHPIKSLLPVEVQSAVLTIAGFRYDRQFILIDDSKSNEAGVFEHLTIKTTSELCLFRQHVDEKREELTVTYLLGNAKESVIIPLLPPADLLASTQAFTVDLFGSRADGQDMGTELHTFFSKYLQKSVRLLYIGDGGKREIPLPSLIPRKPSSFPWLSKDQVHPQKIRFADAAPLLVTTTASEQEARSRLPKENRSEDIIIRFRTNIHVDTSGYASSTTSDQAEEFEPYAEDYWKRISILCPGSNQPPIFLDCVFRSVRCQSLNVDFVTGKLVPPERQLYRLLTKDRRVNAMLPQKPCFGMYCFAEPVDRVIRVGDEVIINEWQTD